MKLSENRDLERRIESVELQIRQLQQHTAESCECNPAHETDIPPTFLLRPREFEKTLYASRVYKRAEHRLETMSFTTSVARESAWSSLSKCSLGDISILSVVALPVYVSELSTGWTLFLHDDVNHDMNTIAPGGVSTLGDGTRNKTTPVKHARLRELQPSRRRKHRKIAIVGSRNVGMTFSVSTTWETC